MRMSKKTARFISFILALSLLVLIFSAAAFSAPEDAVWDGAGTVTEDGPVTEDGTAGEEDLREEQEGAEEAGSEMENEAAEGENPEEENEAAEGEDPREENEAAEGEEPGEENEAAAEEDSRAEDEVTEEAADSEAGSEKEDSETADPEAENDVSDESGSGQEDSEPEEENAETDEGISGEGPGDIDVAEDAVPEEMDPEAEDGVPEEADAPNETDCVPEEADASEEAGTETEEGIEAEDADPEEAEGADPEEINEASEEADIAAEPEFDPAYEEPQEAEPETEEGTADPYFIEGEDYQSFLGLDYSSGRLIIGTDDPSVFADGSVIISSYRNLYMLQFTDIETTMKAYVYYLQKAELVEIDGAAMAVNDEAAADEAVAVNDETPVEEAVPQDDSLTFVSGEIMTEYDNPFAELQAAVAGYGYNNAFDIALIDTGASSYTAGAVSMIGDDTWDDNGHGTEMASYIASQNPDARILSIKAFGSNGLADMSAVYAAFQYALTQNVRIINISASAFAGSGSELLSSAVYEALAAGIVVVASAGNNGRNAGWYVPGGYDGVTTIGACDEHGERRPTSNFGGVVDYHVAADTTSQAAAMFSGFLSRYGSEGVIEVLNQGLIFATDYTYTGDTDDPNGQADPEYPGIERPEIEGLEIEETKTFLVRYTFVDENEYEEGMSITDFYQAGKNSLFQRSEYATAYIDGEDYVFYADQPYLNGYAANDPAAWDFAEGNNEGHVITNGVSFDPVTKVARVHAGMTGTGSAFADIQLQLLIPVSLSSTVHIPIAVSANTEAICFTVGSTVEAGPFTELSFQLMDGSSAVLIRALEELEIYLNDSKDALETTEYTFDRRTGELTILTRTGLEVTFLRINVNLMDDETLLINGYYDGTSTPVLADGRVDLTYNTYLYLKDFDTSRYSVGQAFYVTGKMIVGLTQVPAGGSVYVWYATNPNYFGGASAAPMTPGYTMTYVDNAAFIGLPKILDGQDFTFYKDAACTEPAGDYAAGYPDYNGAFFAYCHHVSSSLYSGSVNAYSGIISVPFLIRIIGMSETAAGNTKIVFSIESTAAETITNYTTYDAQTVGAVFAVETAGQKEGNVYFSVSASDNPGSLKISKTTNSENEPDKRFSFTMEYGPTEAYGTAGTFTLKNGESKDLSMPAGTCFRVTEQDYSSDGWTAYVSTDHWATYEEAGSSAGSFPARAGEGYYVFTVSGLDGTYVYVILSGDGTQTGSGTISNYGMIALRSGETAAILDLPEDCVVAVAETYPLYTSLRTVQKGDSGGDVLGLQWILYEHGYMTEYPDGEFGSVTESAVISFQKTWNLSADGVVGSETGAYLNALNAADYGGNWSGGGYLYNTVTGDQNTNLGTIVNTYVPKAQTIDYYNYQRDMPGDLTFAKKVEIENGSLTVYKTSENGNISGTFEFTLTINGRAGSGYSYTGSAAGKTDANGRFNLKAGESITITGLPPGAAYTVTETQVMTDSGNSGFLTYVEKNGGAFSAGRSVSGTLPAAPENQAFTFQVTGLPSGSYFYYIYNSLNASGTSVSSGTVSNSGQILLKEGQSVKIRDIKAGSTVTVTETVPASGNGTWKCDKASYSASAVVVKNDTVSAGTFTNTFTPKKEGVGFKNTPGVGYLCLVKESDPDELYADNRLYSLEGAVYEVYGESSQKAATLTTNAEGITNAVELPVGTYRIMEVKASPGHLLDPAMTDPASVTVKVGAENTAANPAVVHSSEPVLDALLSIIIEKTGESSEDAKPLEDVKFEIRYYDELSEAPAGTARKIWTIRTLKDQSGKYTAQLDDTIREDGRTWLAEGSDPLYKRNGKTVLPLGTYTVEEIRTAEGYTLTGGYLYADSDPDSRVETDGGKLLFTVEEKGGAAKLSAGNTFTAFNQTPKIRTSLTDKETGLHSLEQSSWIILMDTVSYENLTPGRLYRLSGRLIDKASGSVIRDVSGKEVTAEALFTPETSEGSVVIEFRFDLGETYIPEAVAFEELYEGEVLIAEHKDPEDPKQTVSFTEPPAPEEPPTEPVPEPPTEPEEPPTEPEEPATEPEEPTTVPEEPITAPEPTTEPEPTTAPEPTTVPEEPTTETPPEIPIPDEPEPEVPTTIPEEPTSPVPVPETQATVQKPEPLTYPEQPAPRTPEKPSDTPRTGDTNRTFVYIGLCLAALAAIAITLAILIRRRNRS